MQGLRVSSQCVTSASVSPCEPCLVDSVGQISITILRLTIELRVSHLNIELTVSASLDGQLAPSIRFCLLHTGIMGKPSCSCVVRGL